MDAGYYPRQVGEKWTLSKNDRREHKKRRVMRTQLGGEGSEKSVPDVVAMEAQISDLRSQLDHTTQIIVAKDKDSNNSIRKWKNCNKPIIDANRGWANSGVCGGRKEFSIVGPMQEGEGS